MSCNEEGYPKEPINYYLRLACNWKNQPLTDPNNTRGR